MKKLPRAGSNQMQTTDLAMKESLVVFQNSQGTEMRATLLRLTRHLAVVEIYDPVAVVRTSEVLGQLKITYQDRTLYCGRAVVQTAVSTGLKVISELALQDGWLDVDFVVASGHGEKLRGEFGGFFREWQKLYRVVPEYKVAIADLESFLTDLQLWLNQVELGIRSSPSEDRATLERQVARELEEPCVGAIRSLFDRYEVVAQQVEEELQPAHRAFGRRHLHPLLLCSPFCYRTLNKPLGYAGDYEMVGMMFRDPCEGTSLFAKMVNMYALRLPPIVGHRNRIAHLTDQLQSEALRAAGRGRRLKVLNLGCGPAEEIQEFLVQYDSLCDEAEFTLVDFNEETLVHVKQTLEALKRQHGRRTRFETQKKSVHQILREAACPGAVPNGDGPDFAYCAGLFDYLSDKVCRELIALLYDRLVPGGLLVASNVGIHPSRGEMECFLEWYLIYRNPAELARLVPSYVPPEAITLQCNGTGLNTLMEIRKPERACP